MPILPERFPRLYAAASLKLPDPVDDRVERRRFSAALCRGLIEASHPDMTPLRASGGFPRLYAAASLKLIQRLGVEQ